MGRDAKETAYPVEVWERATRMVFVHRHEYDSQWAAIVSIAAASAFFARELDPQTAEAMSEFIDEHRKDYGVEPICHALAFAPSTYYRSSGAGPTRLRELDATRGCWWRSPESTITATAPTGPTRSGDICAAKASRSPGAPWRD